MKVSGEGYGQGYVGVRIMGEGDGHGVIIQHMLPVMYPQDATEEPIHRDWIPIVTQHNLVYSLISLHINPMVCEG